MTEFEPIPESLELTEQELKQLGFGGMSPARELVSMLLKAQLAKVQPLIAKFQADLEAKDKEIRQEIIDWFLERNCIEWSGVKTGKTIHESHLIFQIPMKEWDELVNKSK